MIPYNILREETFPEGSVKLIHYSRPRSTGIEYAILDSVTHNSGLYKSRVNAHNKYSKIVHDIHIRNSLLSE